MSTTRNAPDGGAGTIARWSVSHRRRSRCCSTPRPRWRPPNSIACSLKGDVADEHAVLDVVDRLSEGSPTMYTRGGGGLGARQTLEPVSFLDALLGIYICIDREPTWLPPSQR